MLYIIYYVLYVYMCICVYALWVPCHPMDPLNPMSPLPRRRGQSQGLTPESRNVGILFDMSGSCLICWVYIPPPYIYTHTHPEKKYIYIYPPSNISSPVL